MQTGNVLFTRVVSTALISLRELVWSLRHTVCVCVCV